MLVKQIHDPNLEQKRQNILRFYDEYQENIDSFITARLEDVDHKRYFTDSRYDFIPYEGILSGELYKHQPINAPSEELLKRGQITEYGFNGKELMYELCHGSKDSYNELRYLAEYKGHHFILTAAIWDRSHKDNYLKRMTKIIQEEDRVIYLTVDSPATWSIVECHYHDDLRLHKQISYTHRNQSVAKDNPKFFHYDEAGELIEITEESHGSLWHNPKMPDSRYQAFELEEESSFEFPSDLYLTQKRRTDLVD